MISFWKYIIDCPNQTHFLIHQTSNNSSWYSIDCTLLLFPIETWCSFGWNSFSDKTSNLIFTILSSHISFHNYNNPSIVHISIHLNHWHSNLTSILIKKTNKSKHIYHIKYANKTSIKPFIKKPSIKHRVYTNKTAN